MNVTFYISVNPVQTTLVKYTFCKERSLFTLEGDASVTYIPTLTTML
ncbi:hypothetical protein [Gloeocapsopsis dulcis]|nr:hypothetical protein [Gloeocapsopsis dulcis]WNN91525.1 hypothetical protein P0S91_10810 [Gloeocapsopsis dulcis]